MKNETTVTLVSLQATINTVVYCGLLWFPDLCVDLSFTSHIANWWFTVRFTVVYWLNHAGSSDGENDESRRQRPRDEEGVMSHHHED